MKQTGSYSRFSEIEMNPEKPFLNDLKNDLKAIDKHYSQKVGNEIKKAMINEILKNIV